MRLIHADDVEFASFSGHREGDIKFRRLLEGPPHRPDSYELSCIRAGADYFTPRHRHNFDQLRFTLRGSFNYGPNHEIAAGTMVYFPEGTFYGPTKATEESVVLMVQYGGANGSGFMTYDELGKGYEELRGKGTFEAGTFRFVDDSGRRHNKDGYEAVYEHVMGRPVEYPRPRYSEPIHIDPSTFDWLPTAETGVTERFLGAFAERRHVVALVRLEPGAQHSIARPDATRLVYVLSGSVLVDDEAHPAHTAIEVLPDDEVTIVADDDVELFETQLHVFAPVLAPA